MIGYRILFNQLFRKIKRNSKLYHSIFGKPPMFVIGKLGKNKFKIIDVIKGNLPSLKFKVRIKKRK